MIELKTLFQHEWFHESPAAHPAPVLAPLTPPHSSLPALPWAVLLAEEQCLACWDGLLSSHLPGLPQHPPSLPWFACPPLTEHPRAHGSPQLSCSCPTADGANTAAPTGHRRAQDLWGRLLAVLRCQFSKPAQRLLPVQGHHIPAPCLHLSPSRQQGKVQLGSAGRGQGRKDLS